ncbi:Nitrilase family, member 2 [Seminavis robusta]|uniref:Nitrilase family, member 2 n=1 Tax=Seminavis robusta TaxID=568900 RepID=A0A9N8H0G9_9STRA|nr:Nitrilase family, member 2 [Seminavis robusta]|eukprot:Sro2_g001270.1 Nitrilase family, member 2 (260) ;mRNA; r:86688-87467
MSSFTTTNAALPEDFAPSAHDVVIGKGKKFYFHAGNQWLRDVVAERIAEYSQATTKADKSNIISKVVEYISQNGRFVKIDTHTGQWVYAEPLLCREKCSQTFRDNLAQTYRSSNVAKRNKRRQEQQEKSNYMSVFFNKAVTIPVPSSKRMRMTVTPEPETQAPAAWFDWEVPIRNLEEETTIPAPVSSCSRRMSFSFQDFEDLINLIPESYADDAFEPFQLDLSTSDKASARPMKDFSASSTMGLERSFQRRTAAAFAA